jgi:hypothetical protein
MGYRLPLMKNKIFGKRQLYRVLQDEWKILPVTAIGPAFFACDSAHGEQFKGRSERSFIV